MKEDCSIIILFMSVGVPTKIRCNIDFCCHSLWDRNSQNSTGTHYLIFIPTTIAIFLSLSHLKCLLTDLELCVAFGDDSHVYGADRLG